MKRIGVDARIWRAESGGVGRYCRNLLTELLEIDHENEYTAILTPADEKEFTLEAPNLKKLVVDIGHYSVAEQRTFPRILKEQQFDLVHFTHFNHPILYRGKFVVTVHDLIMHLFPMPSQPNVKRIGYKLVMNDARRAERIIVPSQATKKDLIEMLHFPAKKISVTYEGSESRFRLHNTAEIAAIKKKLHLPDTFILFVSRWEKYKGLGALVPAFRRLVQDFPDLGFVITGKPWKHAPEIAELVRSAQADGLKIITPGFVSDADLAPLYSAASVYVHPSWYEGFGIMILEAFASGTPTVTSTISSLPEVAGDAGLLVNPHSTDEITEAIHRILSNPQLAKELREKGLARAREFSWARMAAETLEVYKKVLA